jgi:hypothetical protein
MVPVLAITYMKTQRVTGNRGNCLILHVADDKGFIAPRRMGRRKSGGLKFKACAIMLLKTHIEKMSILGSAIISMKTKGFFRSCHHIYENKWT